MKLRVKEGVKRHIIGDPVRNKETNEVIVNRRTYSAGMVFEGSAETLANNPDKLEKVDEKTPVDKSLEEQAASTAEAPQQEEKTDPKKKVA